jgi:hypothetical protein
VAVLGCDEELCETLLVRRVDISPERREQTNNRLVTVKGRSVKWWCSSSWSPSPKSPRARELFGYGKVADASDGVGCIGRDGRYGPNGRCTRSI